MIRTTVIAGRPDLGHPDWRGYVPGHPLTDSDVSDVTAWLLAQRLANPGQSYPDNSTTSEKPGRLSRWLRPHPSEQVSGTPGLTPASKLAGTRRSR